MDIISLFLISNVYPFNYGSGKQSKVETHQLLRVVKSVAVWGVGSWPVKGKIQFTSELVREIS